MKFSIKIGAIKLNAVMAAVEPIKLPAAATPAVIAEANKNDRNTHGKPSKNIQFDMGESQVEFECEAGELPAIYREMQPMFKDMMRALMHVKAVTGTEKTTQSQASASIDITRDRLAIKTALSNFLSNPNTLASSLSEMVDHVEWCAFIANDNGVGEFINKARQNGGVVGGKAYSDFVDYLLPKYAACRTGLVAAETKYGR